MQRAALANATIEATTAELEERFVARNPRSRARFEAACRAMPGANTRTVLHYDPFPLAFARGEGARLWDLDGHGYIDFQGEYSAGLYGHSDPTIRAAVETALAEGIVLGGANRYEAELARLLVERFPSCARVRFCNSGTEANLMALSLARAATGRSRILVFEGGYHGGVFYYAKGGSPLNVPFPTVVAPYNDIDGTRALIARHEDALAAAIVEPMMGGAGCIPGEPGFLRMLREETARRGILLIFDEVMTSRAGPGGMQGLLGLAPDLTSFGKYLGGGLTFGAFGGRADLMDRFDPRAADAFPHSGTYNNNVLTMAAGLAGLSQVLTPAAIARLNGLAERLRARLEAAAARAGLPLQVTGAGSILGLHFQRAPIRRAADVATPPAVRKLVHLALLERGIYIARRGFMSLSLPMTEADIESYGQALEDLLAVYRGPLQAALNERS